jgi:multicomponent Na+:H+ antiporter subunit E
MIGHFILRMGIWLLLTANLSPANIAIGIGAALLLPRGAGTRAGMKAMLQALGRVIAAVPRAYAEAVVLLILFHPREEVIRERVRAGRSPGLVFLDIFRITFTPKTLVVKYHEGAGFDVHRIRRRRPRCS